MFKTCCEKEDLTLKEQTEALFEDMEKLLVECLGTCGLDISSIANADDDMLILFKKYMKLVKDCEDLAVKQADMLDKISTLDKKLDKIDTKLDKMK
jgi:hypothetical protein